MQYAAKEILARLISRSFKLKCFENKSVTAKLKRAAAIPNITQSSKYHNSNAVGYSVITCSFTFVSVRKAGFIQNTITQLTAIEKAQIKPQPDAVFIFANLTPVSSEGALLCDS